MEPDYIKDEDWELFMGKYFVSSYGRIWNIRLKRLLTFGTNVKGYASVGIPFIKSQLVHRIVADIFMPQSCEDKCQINHKNGDKKDNRILNLEWVTPSENMKHSYSELGRKSWLQGITGENHPRFGLTGELSPLSKPVIRISSDGEIKYYSAIAEAGRDGFEPANIKQVIDGKRKHCRVTIGDLQQKRKSKMKQRKIKYESEIKTYTFFHEEKEIITTIEVFYKIVPPDYDSWDSPEDYYGYTELKSWEVISVEDHEGNEVKPEEVLTEKQLLAYNQGLEEFVES